VNVADQGTLHTATSLDCNRALEGASWGEAGAALAKARKQASLELA
jgi:hypothetical protein